MRSLLQNVQAKHFHTTKLKLLPLFIDNNQEHNAYIQKNKEENNQILQYCLKHGLDHHLLYTLHSAHLFASKQIQDKNNRNQHVCYNAPPQ